MEKEDFKYNEIAEILKVLAHPVRLCIIVNLLKHGESNVTNMQDCLKIPQSTLSQHLQKLRSAKLIEGNRKGLEVNYHIIDDSVAQLVKALLIVKTQK
jgi:DNA-binding transcriptional ArsR family regulator